MPNKLFIPGPVAVSERTYRAMATPLIPHRGEAFANLYNKIQEGLRSLFYTQDPIFLLTSSSWGAMEAGIRNFCSKKVLCCCCGAFSDKWYEVALACGKQATPLRFDWGTAVQPELVRQALAADDYDCLTLVHNETSTGIANPLEEIMAVVREFPNVIALVDAVSSFSAQYLPKDKWGIDVMLSGSQKALALPPGLALLSVSKRALDRAKEVPHRGYYFDCLAHLETHKKGLTLSTPPLPLIFGLNDKLDEIREEGIEKRYLRHATNNQMVRKWIENNGFKLFPDPKFASISMSCIANTRKIDLHHLAGLLKEKHNLIMDTGYGKLKGNTFRLSNMGNETSETMRTLLDALTSCIGQIA